MAAPNEEPLSYSCSIEQYAQMTSQSTATNINQNETPRRRYNQLYNRDRVCFNCASTTTSKWYRDKDGEFNCKTCYLYYKRQDKPRPLELHLRKQSVRAAKIAEESPKVIECQTLTRDSSFAKKDMTMAYFNQLLTNENTLVPPQMVEHITEEQTTARSSLKSPKAIPHQMSPCAASSSDQMAPQTVADSNQRSVETLVSSIQKPLRAADGTTAAIAEISPEAAQQYWTSMQMTSANKENSSPKPSSSNVSGDANQSRSISMTEMLLIETTPPDQTDFIFFCARCFTNTTSCWFNQTDGTSLCSQCDFYEAWERENRPVNVPNNAIRSDHEWEADNDESSNVSGHLPFVTQPPSLADQDMRMTNLNQMAATTTVHMKQSVQKVSNTATNSTRDSFNGNQIRNGHGTTTNAAKKQPTTTASSKQKPPKAVPQKKCAVYSFDQCVAPKAILSGDEAPEAARRMQQYCTEAMPEMRQMTSANHEITNPNTVQLSCTASPKSPVNQNPTCSASPKPSFSNACNASENLFPVCVDFDQQTSDAITPDRNVSQILETSRHEINAAQNYLIASTSFDQKSPSASPNQKPIQAARPPSPMSMYQESPVNENPTSYPSPKPSSSNVGSVHRALSDHTKADQNNTPRRRYNQLYDRKCANCSTTTTTMWRRNKDRMPVCNPCGQYYTLHGENRPARMFNNPTQKRNKSIKTKCESASSFSSMDNCTPNYAVTNVYFDVPHMMPPWYPPFQNVPPSNVHGYLQPTMPQQLPPSQNMPFCNVPDYIPSMMPPQPPAIQNQQMTTFTTVTEEFEPQFWW